MKIFLYICVHIKSITCKFRILNPRILKLFPVKFVNFLKISLIFNIFYCLHILCKQTFHLSQLRISQRVKGVLMWNLQHIFIWRWRWRWRYWQIFKSALVPLKSKTQVFENPNIETETLRNIRRVLRLLKSNV